MKITIIPEDGSIGIDGEFLLGISQEYLEWIPENVHAVQWFGDIGVGEIQFKPLGPLEPSPPNVRIEELGIYEQAIIVYQQEIQRRIESELAKQAAIEASRDYKNELRLLRDSKLIDSDWTQLVDAPLTEEQKILWQVYRQQLRDIPENIENEEDYKNMVLDPNHPLWPIAPN
jgi:hypothetical protein